MKKVWWYGYGASFTQQMEGFLNMQFARGMGTRLRGLLQSASVIWRKKL
jgi:hypothetical protein